MKFDPNSPECRPIVDGKSPSERAAILTAWEKCSLEQQKAYYAVTRLGVTDKRTKELGGEVVGQIILALVKLRKNN